MRGDFSAIPEVSDTLAITVLHEQGRVLSDHALNLQNLLLHQRMIWLESMLTQIAVALPDASKLPIVIDKVTKDGENLTLPNLVQINEAHVARLWNPPDPPVQLTKDKAIELLENKNNQDKQLLTLCAHEDIQGLGGSMHGKSLILHQRNLLKILPSIPSDAAPTWTWMGSQLKPTASVQRLVIHKRLPAVDANAAKDGKAKPERVVFKYSSTNLARIYSGELAGSQITLTGGDVVQFDEHSHVEFLVPVPEDKDLVKDSLANKLQQEFYRLEQVPSAARGTKVNVASIDAASPIPLQGNRCQFVVWDWVETANVPDNVPDSVEVKRGAAAFKVDNIKAAASIYGWTALVSPGHVDAKPRPSRKTVWLKQLVAPAAAAPAAAAPAAAEPAATEPAAAEPAAAEPAAAEPAAAEPAAAEPAAPAAEPAVATPIAGNSFPLSPIAIRDIPVRLLDLTYRTPELRRWASSVDLSEVASLSPESLMERVRRCGAMPADRQPQLAADVMSFADQIRIIAGQLRVNDQAVQTA